MAKKRTSYSDDLKQQMIEFYKDNPEADHPEAQKHAKELGQETFSKGMHDQLLRRATGPVKVPKQVAMDLKTGDLKRLESISAGDRVAIYELKKRARIEMIDEEEES
jgi:hypothetical protein